MVFAREEHVPGLDGHNFCIGGPYSDLLQLGHCHVVHVLWGAGVYHHFVGGSGSGASWEGFFFSVK